MSMNFDQARFNMVEQQVRTWEVLDDAILELFTSIPREDFVPQRYRKLAFADLNIPLDHDQVMMKPAVEGRMLQALEIKEDETVLEIGTGSGYITACLAGLAKRVCSVEVFESLSGEALERLDSRGIENIECYVGDAMRDWLPEQAHDVVVVTGSAPKVPQRFTEWVNPGGRLFIIRGDAPAMEAVCLTREGVSDWLTESLFETDIPRLINAEQEPAFEF